MSQDTLVLSVIVYSSDTNKDSHYPITHPKNHGRLNPVILMRSYHSYPRLDQETLEEVDFTLDMTTFRDKLTKFTKKGPRTRGLTRKHPQGVSGPQRRSVRKRIPTAKSRDYQSTSGSLKSDIDLTEDEPTPQISPSEGFSLDISSSHDTPGSSQQQQPSTPSSEPNDQEASSPPPTDDDSTPEQYYRVHYNFIMEVDGLIIKYRMEIPDANEFVEGEINLAHILPPGSS